MIAIFQSCLLPKMRLSVVLEGRYTGYTNPINEEPQDDLTEIFSPISFSFSDTDVQELWLRVNLPPRAVITEVQLSL